VTRTQGFYGSSPNGCKVLLAYAGSSLNLMAGDPLLMIFPSGTLVPVNLGGVYFFPTVESIKGLSMKGATDGGFLPGIGRPTAMPKSVNILPQQTLTLALNLGLSMLGAGTMSSSLTYAQDLPRLVVNNPGGLGDGMTALDILLLARAAVAAGAGDDSAGLALSQYVTLPPGTPDGTTVSDLIMVVTSINEGCDTPDQESTNFLRVPTE